MFQINDRNTHTCEESMEKGYLKIFWSGVHLGEKERKSL